MKKEYFEPKYEAVVFSTEDIITGSSCSDDCTHCFFLVCEPEDVIIGG